MESEILLIEGLPGSGKTTLIRKLCERLGRHNCAGFFTSEIRKRGTRTGFQWETFDGETGILADLSSGQPRVGKYHVHLESFDEMLMKIGEIPADKLLLIDEVGKMECLSQKFCLLLPRWESMRNRKILTVPARGTPFIENFKSRHRKRILQISGNNRAELLETILNEGIPRAQAD